ncbi:glycosyl transferase family 1 [Fischerella thermalis WC245]|uniref:glycosyltransferase family 4 protein n=2 Tax=Fischerella thermalis TaxID=372787 RepID=UPI000C7FE24F|nr:glycosyltransferase family 4 protein [Fischerella thermalis]PLZ04583.1 glycosyl transferase family 1 [Fischerella thermalis WC119]PLZ32260.1 glycosyl transferase family 1 [Fischerella thermalis WC558]PLZ58412.1 glycosyl transferase family 1 [Fischerella thermalis WC344]PLZ63849.1 glycosyl transferase family 1 [Fischerella thermalis WC439]PLZ76762.1 glycosyl transferase family 1 [Fischerella thermalis WC245]
MEKLANNTLSRWREENSLLIPQNFGVFRNLVAEAREFANHGNYNAAAVYAEIAAFHAQFKHCGLFSSPELENILLKIGRQITQTTVTPTPEPSLSKRPKNILHVSTNISSPFGGIPRFIRRWIQQDTQRSHSLALTKQAPNEVPQILTELVSNSHGKIFLLNETIGGFISRAKRLRKIAATADIVVLHIWEHDVIPIIAFANKELSPPIIYVNHGDHCFWLGAAVSDVVANLRESGMRLSQKRRGIEAERNMLLPTILEPSHRQLSRTQAKQQLGIDENSTLLLSIARAPKYRKTDGISFADAHVPLLKKHDRAILVVIGPGGSEDWSTAIQQTQGRIIALGHTEDTAVYYQAADIYVDSYPFVSITSLLEAGSYGVPLVSRYPYSSDACEILGADMPGLTGNLIRVHDLEEYTTVLSRLVADEELRLSLGEATRRRIVEVHMGSNWQHNLEEVYTRAASLPRVKVTSSAMDQMFITEPDVFWIRDHSWNCELDDMIQPRLPIMPFEQRLYHWMRLAKKHGWQNQISLLLPEWFRLRYYLPLRSVLKMGNRQ